MVVPRIQRMQANWAVLLRPRRSETMKAITDPMIEPAWSMEAMSFSTEESASKLKADLKAS